MSLERVTLYLAVAVGALAFTMPHRIVCAEEQDLRGANAVLQEPSVPESTPAPARPYAPGDALLKAELKKLTEDIAEFAGATSASPKEAAETWLTFLVRWRVIVSDRSARISSNRLSFDALVRGLPPPESWPLICEKLEAEAVGPPTRTSVLLRAFAALLRNDDAALNTSLERMETLFDGERFLGATLHHLKAHLLACTDDGDVATDLFQTTARYRVDFPTAVPDLVALVGENKATRLLTEALKQTTLLDLSRAGRHTATLVRRLALEMIDDLGTPQWELAESLEAGPLFEALVHRFGKGDGSDRQNDSVARPCYLLGLIARNQIDKAIAFVEVDKRSGNSIGNLPEEALHALRTAGKSREAYAFVDRLMSVDTDAPNWENYLGMTAVVGDFGDSVKLLAKWKTSPKLDPGVRRDIGRHPWRLYVSLGYVEEGIRALRAMLDESVWKHPVDDGDFTGMPWFFDRSLKLANLGRVLHRAELIDEGLRDARAFFAVPEDRGEESDPPRQPNCARLTAFTAEVDGRPRVAEDMLQAQVLMDWRYETQQWGPHVAHAAQSRATARELFAQSRSAVESHLDETRHDLVALAGLYGRQHRPEDVVTLLDRAAGWNARDLGEIVNEADWSRTPLGYTAARAFCDLERKDEARRVLGVLLEAGCDHDPAYELFLQLTPPGEAVAVFDRLLERDPFELRPSIWKAEALKRLNRLDEAETAARAAMQIDPSDAGQRCGLRMRAYATLADVLAAAGKDPEPYRSAVKAIRLAEDADTRVEVDLLGQAVPIYEQALGLFADAYCIQARLAIQLTTIGKREEATKHYQRAFDLMPSSIGRAGNPCFGCERIFAAHEAQEIAERVFTSMAEQPSAKPQVFYLFGALRIAQGRYQEALDMTRQAVILDPDYLNAWKQIGMELPLHLHVPRAERDAALLHVLRLDPNRRHSNLKMDSLRDFVGLWKTLDAARPRLPAPHPECYRLAASARFEEEMRGKVLPPAEDRREEVADEFMCRGWKGSLDRSHPLPPAGEILAEQESMHDLVLALDDVVPRR